LQHSAPLQHHLRSTHGLSLAQRLTHLKAELAALENELGESQKESSPALEDDDEEPVDIGAEIAESNKPKKSIYAHGHVETGELIKEVVDVKARLEKIGKIKEGKTEREKLLNAVLQGTGERVGVVNAHSESRPVEGGLKDEKAKEEGISVKMEVRDIAEMDRRLGEIERAVGSSSTYVDEVWSALVSFM
jgi:nuclear migration protein JNM1